MSNLCLSSQLIDEQVLCVHGGLSPDIKTLDQIRTIERNQEIPHKGAFCDLVWSDPEDVDTWAISPRGAGWLFGSKVTNEVRPRLAAGGRGGACGGADLPVSPPSLSTSTT